MPPRGSRHRMVVVALSVCLALTLAAGFALGAVPAAPDGESQPQVDDAQPRVVELGNTSNYVLPDRGEATRDGIGYQEVDVGLAVATGVDTLESHHERRAFDRRFGAAENQSERLRTFGESVTSLEDRTGRLRSAHQEARTSFRDDSITAREYFRTVARLDAATERAETLRLRLETDMDGLPPSAQAHLATLRRLEVDLDSMDGPATDQLRARYEGNASAGASFLTVTGDDGFVLATTNDGQLYREAQDSGDWNRDGAGGGSADLGQLLDRVGELYSWTASHQFGYRTDFLDTSLNKIAVAHQHGDLTVYIDSSTEDVFRETQENRLNAVPRDWSRSATTDDLQLRVNGSHETGPLEVRLSQATGEDGVDGDVRIDDTYVGETDADGGLWTVQPPGEFTLNATTSSNQTVTLTVPDGVG